MGEKRGRIPAVASHLIDDEILNHKNQILGDLQINEAEGKSKKLLHQMPSYRKINQCTNFLCPEFSIQNSCEVITLSALNGCINIQKDIDNFTKNEIIKYSKCDSNRKITINTKSHILIELGSIPQGLELSTSVCSISDIDLVHQNYAGEVMLTADEIPKILLVNDQTYFLRGAVVFTSGNRPGLRVTSGHYTAYSFRSNDRWEVYDDLKENVQQYKNQKNNFELLLYTK